MEYKVKKGLEQPLRIQGMLLIYFYTWLISAGVVVLFLVSLLLRVTQSESNASFTTFAIVLVSSGILLLGMKFFFVHKSRTVKMKFQNRRVVLSNIDIMKALK